MDMQTYQAHARGTAIYPGSAQADRLAYTTLGLVGEAGEVAEKVKKILRDDAGVVRDIKIDEIKLELGDVMWYIAMCAHELGLTLDEVAASNVDKLYSRQERSQLHGSGDTR